MLGGVEQAAAESGDGGYFHGIAPRSFSAPIASQV